MKLFNKFLFCFFLSAVFFVSAQAQKQNKIDSLLQVLKTAKEDTSKINTLNRLSRQIWETGNYELAKKYADDAVQL